MVRTARHALLAAVISVAMVAVCWPGAAFAATSSAITDRMRAKQKQAEAAEAQLSVLRPQLAARLAEFDAVSENLDAAREELSRTAVKLEELDVRITADQTVLDGRIVEMYKNGGVAELEVLLSTTSMQDFVERMDLITLILDSDVRFLTALREAREESESLRQQQERRQSELMVLRQEAASRRAQVDAATASQEQIMRSLTTDIAQLVKEREIAAAAEAAAEAAARIKDGWKGPPVPFPPGTAISDANYLASGSMSAEAIQAFLNAQTGSLKSYSGPDHNGVRKTAAQMIAEACVAHGVSPKVVLATLQKEQSLISRSSPSQYAMDWAMGCGKAESYTIASYKGFGMQIWQGARVLIKNRSGWRSGCRLPIDGTTVYPTNASTYSLYRYTPHFAGVTSFWRIYWRYFGDTMK
jgi:peptidoglycan hydrolase CwlO-like protein